MAVIVMVIVIVEISPLGFGGLFTLHSPVRFSMICLFEGISLQFVVHRIADRFQPLIACSLMNVLVIGEVLEP